MNGSNPSTGNGRSLRSFGLLAMALMLIGLMAATSASAATTELLPTRMKIECNEENLPEVGEVEGGCVVFVNSPSATVGAITGNIILKSDKDIEFGPLGDPDFTLLPLSPQESIAGFTYIPFTPGKHTFTAIYHGDRTHGPSEATFTVEVVPVNPTTTKIECNEENAPEVGEVEGACVVFVNTAEPNANEITGKVAMQGGEDVEFRPLGGDDFTLQPNGPNQSIVSFVYVASATGPHTFTARYEGMDGHHAASEGSININVLPKRDATSVAALNCGALEVNRGSSCFVAVKDLVVGASTPTGSVKLTSSTSGTFSHPDCALSLGICIFSYTPHVKGPVTLTGAYQGDEKHKPSQKSVKDEVR